MSLYLVPSTTGARFLGDGWARHGSAALTCIPLGFGWENRRTATNWKLHTHSKALKSLFHFLHSNSKGCHDAYFWRAGPSVRTWAIPNTLFFQIPLWPLKMTLSSPLELQITEKFICFLVPLSLRDMLIILKHLHISRAIRNEIHKEKYFPDSLPRKEEF